MATGFQLTPATAVEHLARRGLLPPGAKARAVELAGGVSSVVVRVDAKAGAWVLKQPLATFRVRDPWHVDVRRAAVEHRFATLVEATLGPGLVARPFDHDPDRQVLITQALPTTFRSWKAWLLDGHVEPSLAARAGRLLARLHRLDATGLEEPRLFEQQRLDPYFSTAARRNPDVAPILRSLNARLRQDQTALVHGDFSPKNLLTDGDGLVLVDHEVATRCDPRFDVAFLLNHLVLKAAKGVDAERLGEAAQEFLYAYARAKAPAPDDEAGGLLLWALMLARVDGKSPVEYLTAPQSNQVRGAATRGLLGPELRLSDAVAHAFSQVTA